MSHLELQEFFAEGSDQQASHVLLHITEPSTPEEIAKGYFFALIEINNGSIAHIEHLQKIIDDLESGYYDTPEDGKDPFETTLGFINRRSAQVLTDSSVHIHAIVGVIKDSLLSFSTHGSPNALLFYRQKQEFGTMNLMENHTSSDKELFPSVLQGTLNTGDFFFVGTPHVTEYFAPDRLQKLITGKSVKQSSEHIDKVLRDMHSAHSFGGITFRILPQTERKTPVQKAPAPAATAAHGSAASLNKLMHNKRQTAETLSPPVFRHLLRQVKDLLQKKNTVSPVRRAQSSMQTSAKVPEQQRKETLGDALLIGFGRAIVNGVAAIAKLIGRVFLGGAKLCIAIFILLTNKNNSRKEVVKEWKKFGNSILDRFENLPVISKLLFFLTIIACLVFAGSLATMRYRREQVKAQESFNNLTLAVQQKKDAAEASIIYHDTATALTLLKEAQQLMDQFPLTEEAATKKEVFSAGITDTLFKLQKMVQTTPEQLVDLTTLNKAAAAQKVIRIDDTLLVFGEHDSVLYKFDLNSKELTAVNHDGIQKLRGANTPKEQDTAVFISGEQSLAGYQKDTSSLIAKDISFPVENAHIIDAFVYNVRLYTLEKNTNQIYKHSKTQTGYDKGTAWLKSSIDASQAVSLAIDGDMFVLHADGAIKKYTRGEEQPFSTSGIEPSLSHPSMIWTYNEVNNIYILEPTNKRLVVLDKNGKLIQQYSADAWKGPTGMVIDEPGKTAYILDQNRIFKMQL